MMAVPFGYGAEELAPLAQADRDFQKALEIWGDGKSPAAEQLLNQALAIRLAQLGANDPKVAEVIERLGALSFNRKQYGDAEAKFRKALDIDIKALGEENINTAFLMGDLGAALREEYRYEEAQTIVERSLALRRKLLPPNDLSIAGSLNNLGRISLGERRYPDARRSFEESLRIYASSLPPDHPRIREGKALLQSVDNAEAGAGEFLKMAKVLGVAALTFLSLAVLIVCNLWSEHRHISNSSNRPLLVKAVSFASIVGLFGSAGVLGALAADWFIVTVMSSIVGDSDTLPNLGKIGFLVGIWISAIALQLLSNIGRRSIGLSTYPIVYFHWSAVEPRLPRGDGGNHSYNWPMKGIGEAMNTSQSFSIDAEFRQNEKAIWKGKPATGIMLRGSDALFIPFSLLWGGFAIFWETTAISIAAKTTPNDQSAAAAVLIFPLFGIPFVLVGLYLIFGRFVIDAKRREKTEYAITNQRVIIKSGFFSRKVKSLNLASMPEISFTEKSNGTGTITFGESNSPYGFMMRGFSWPGMPYAPTFEMIDNVRSVFELIQKAQRNELR